MSDYLSSVQSVAVLVKDQPPYASVIGLEHDGDT